MNGSVYRYKFHGRMRMEDVECAMVVALLATESLHGETQVRLDTSHYFNHQERVCVVDARTLVGRDLNRLFAGQLRREFGEDQFDVRRVATFNRPRRLA